MNLLLVDNAHIYKTPDGRMFTPSVYDATFFARYLDVFDEIHLLAKTKHVDQLDEVNCIRLDIKRLQIIELPWYQGIRQMLAVLPKLLRVYRHAGADCSVTIYRVCQMESFFSFLLRRSRQPFFLEVVNDPDTFTTLPRIMRRLNVAMLRLMLWRAAGASFVTERVLQQRYLPPQRARDPRYPQSHYSSVEIRPSDFRLPRTFPEKLQQLRLIHVANSIADDVKGHQTVLRTAERLRAQGRHVSVQFIGDGPFVGELKRRVASSTYLAGHVQFLGRFHNRQELFEHLAAADLYLYPTQLEGLPRSLIEAMAAGLPALSTPIAGIPELLEADCLFDPFDDAGFAARLASLMDDPAQLEHMSRDNVAVARRYENTALNSRRQAFYSEIRAHAERKP